MPASSLSRDSRTLPSNADATFIAAANPAAVLELVRRVRAAEADVSKEREACAMIVDSYGGSLGTGPSSLDPAVVRAIGKVCAMISTQIRGRGVEPSNEH